MKARYPDVFARRLLKCPSRWAFYAPRADRGRDAREHGVEIRPAANVNASEWDCIARAPARPRPSGCTAPMPSMRDDIRATHALRLGPARDQGAREEEMRILAARRARANDSVRDLC